MYTARKHRRSGLRPPLWETYLTCETVERISIDLNSLYTQIYEANLVLVHVGLK